MKRLVPFLIVLALAACSTNPFTQDPFTRAGTWAPTNDNDANLRAMVANPHDLVAGEPMDGSVGGEAARPVANLLAGKRASLPNISADQIYGTSGGNGSAPTGGTNGGG
jgi:hypothetical protein